ncbi:FxLD family lanthipeptide [Catenuloplanes indicus]|uniref:FxLD family lantipeptide n=1 Tax=Catenuloplanes indicus TaxID=137267 RepID=A0AAE3W1A1_9ACTN|nr:FxLD family lanthipeptide [Catenuloplanes indicus]MDQ0366944.1 FxLD family lantipeptide [Catenuloplanes indicus]
MLEVLDRLSVSTGSGVADTHDLHNASPTALAEGDALTDDDFVLDMTVVESTTPLVTLMCSTSDGCGNSCSTSACTTKASEPL